MSRPTVGPGPIANDCTCPDGDLGWHYPGCIGGHGRPPAELPDLSHVGAELREKWAAEEVPRTGPADPDAAAPVDENDPEEGHPT